MKTVSIKCPARINLFFNINGYNKLKQSYTISAVNQTIDLYDKIIIKDINYPKTSINKSINISIIPNSENIISLEEEFYHTCKIFFAYTGINPHNLVIAINKKINIEGLGDKASDIAGILLGLNTYYNTNLTNHELRYLASLVNLEAPYFINGGYAKITGCGENIKPLNQNNPFNYYLILTPDTKIIEKEIFDSIPKDHLNIKNFKEGTIYNDFNEFMPDELKRLREFLLNYPELNHSLSGIGPSYFIATNNLIPTTLKRTLKKEFPNFNSKIQKNCHGHSIITKI